MKWKASELELTTEFRISICISSSNGRKFFLAKSMPNPFSLPCLSNDNLTRCYISNLS